MRVPVTWLRELVDLPGRGRHGAARRPPHHVRPQARGDPHRRRRPGGPARRGSRAERGARAAEERQDDPLVLGRRGGGRAARHRLRRPQLRRRRPRRRRAARCSAARRLRHRRPQDLRARLRRHDLLAAGARPARRRPAASSCWTPKPQPGDDAAALLGLHDEVLELEVNPDRGYALSMRGVARDTALAFDLPFADPADLDVPFTGEGFPVRVDDPDACPVFAARTVTGFDPSRPTPAWMARRLEQAGMRSISLAVDVTNYVMLELGHPIHGYDLPSLQGGIVVRRATEGEKLTTLDGVVRTLSVDDTVVCDDRGPIGLAGVMGGAETELSATTTDLLIEAAHWKAPMIARTSRLHKLISEASKRYERGVDPALPARATQRVAELLVEHGGGVIGDGLTVVGEAAERSPVTDPRRPAGPHLRRRRSTRRRSCRRSRATDAPSPSTAAQSRRPRRAGGSTSPTRTTSSRTSCASSATTRSRPSLPPAPAGRGLTAAQVLRRRVGMVLAGAGPRGGQDVPVRRPVRLRPARVCRRRRSPPPGAAGEPVVGRAAGHDHDAAGRAAVHGRAQPRPGPHRRPDRRDRPGVPPAARARAAPIYGVDRRPTDAELEAFAAALPSQPQHVAYVMSGERERSRMARTRPSGCLGRRRGGRPPSGGGAAPAADRGAGRAWRPGTRAGAPRCCSTEPSSVTPASCTREWRGSYGFSGRWPRPRSTSTRSSTPLPTSAHDRGSRRSRSPRRTSPSSSTPTFPSLVVHAALVGREPADRVGAAVRRLHRRPGAGGQEVARLRPAPARS